MYPGIATTKKIAVRKTQVLPFRNEARGRRKSVYPSLLAPAANISENVSEYKLMLAVPGLQREDFCIKTDNQLLFISAKTEITHNGFKEDLSEYDYSDWTRTFSLPDDADTILAHAKYRNGELLIRIPRGNTKESRTNTTVYVY